MDDVEIVPRAISAVEGPRIDEVRALYHRMSNSIGSPVFTMAATHSGPTVATMDRTFADTWMPLRPDAETRRMDPRVVAATDGHVVVSYIGGGRTSEEIGSETETLAHYQVKEGKLRYARMYHFDRWVY